MFGVPEYCCYFIVGQLFLSASIGVLGCELLDVFVASQLLRREKFLDSDAVSVDAEILRRKCYQLLAGFESLKHINAACLFVSATDRAGLDRLWWLCRCRVS